jgi:hypothetical protein
MERLTKSQILTALGRLNDRLRDVERKAHVYLVGGAVMCLVHEVRSSTKDVDAWFTEPVYIRKAVKAVAEELRLPEDWLNDAAKGFIPGNAGFEAWQSFSHLDISVADDRTLLAMKCAAARTAEDAEDIRFLVRHLKLSSPEQVLSIVTTYFPPERLPVRTRLLVEEIFHDSG